MRQVATKVALRALRATRSDIAGVRRAVVQGFFNRLLSHFEPNIEFSGGMTPILPAPGLGAVGGPTFVAIILIAACARITGA